MIALGNKLDLVRGTEEYVQFSTANSYLKGFLSNHYKDSHGDIPYLETSALTGDNVETAFFELSYRILSHYTDVFDEEEKLVPYPTWPLPSEENSIKMTTKK